MKSRALLILASLSVLLSFIAPPAPVVEAAKVSPEAPRYCYAWFERPYGGRGKVHGRCSGSGWFQVEAKCTFFDNGPYSWVNGDWDQAPAGQSDATCTSARPLIVAMRWDFTR